MSSSRPGAVKNFYHHQDMSRYTQATVMLSGGLRPVNSDNDSLWRSQRQRCVLVSVVVASKFNRPPIIGTPLCDGPTPWIWFGTHEQERAFTHG